MLTTRRMDSGCAWRQAYITSLPLTLMGHGEGITFHQYVADIPSLSQVCDGRPVVAFQTEQCGDGGGTCVVVTKQTQLPIELIW